MKSASDDGHGLCSARWLLGFSLLGIVATTVDVIVLGMVPLSVVAPFAGLTIVFSVLLASSGLVISPAERLSRSDTGCILMVLVGVTLVSAFGPHTDRTPALEELVSALSRPQFFLFVIVAAVASAINLCPLNLGGSAACPTWAVPVLSAFAAASCGCLSQLMLKLVSTAIGELHRSHGEAGGPALCFAIAGLLISAPLHLNLLNKTLAGAACTVSVPCYQFLMMFCTTAAGGLLFDEFASQPWPNVGAYAIGVIVAAAGLGVLAQDASANSDSTAVELAAVDEGDDKGVTSLPEEALGSLDQALSDISDAEGGSCTSIENDDPEGPPRYVHTTRRRGLRSRRPSFLLGLPGEHAVQTAKRSSFLLGGIGTTMQTFNALIEAREVSLRNRPVVRKRSEVRIISYHASIAGM